MPALTPPHAFDGGARDTREPLLYMIGNAHLDPVWLWRWPEGRAEAIGTCWAAVELLDEQPGAIFTRGEAAIYRWIEDDDPPLFARIRDHVRAGRWAIANGWWIQPDCNLPHGEALLRQALHGKRYFRERFGVEVTTGYNVDSFGHAATLPMLLRHTGSHSYVFMRPQAHEKALPSELFDWEAADGSRVTAFRIQEAYTTAPEALRRRVVHDEALARQAGYPFMCFYGVGNHGGGPSRADLALIGALQAEGHDLAFGDPARYFAAVAAVPRPRVRDELQYHAIGCYSAISALKALNRRAESALAQAESASALALLHAGAPYPRGPLRALWRTLLFNHFHDILAGTSIPSATRDALEALGGVAQGAEEPLHAALRRLAATVAPAPPGPDAAFLAFNLTGVAHGVPIEYEPWLRWRREPRLLLDEAGEEVPYQDLPPESYTQGLRRILFAPRAPAFGYRLFRFVAGAPAPVSSPLRVDDATLENARWRVLLDPVTGGIARLVDRQAGRDLLAGVGHLAMVVDDATDTWSHGVDRFGVTGLTATCERLEVVERGPLRAGLRAHAQVGPARISSTYLLHADPAEPIEIRVHIDWHGRRQLLRLCYPLALAAPTFRYEVPYGSLIRPADGREWPGQRWVLATGDGGGYGLALANDAKYSYAAGGSTLYLTALRSPAFAHHDPYALQPGEEYAYTDQGEQSFTIRVLAGPEIDARAAYGLAEELHRPAVVTPHVARGGRGPWRASLLPIESRSAVPAWLKAAEEGDELIVRLLEVAGERSAATLPGAQDAVTVAAYGLTTLRGTPAAGWRLSDGLEQDSHA